MGTSQSHAATCSRLMSKLLIHADPGARSGFIAAWITNNLQNAGFDVGATVRSNFFKIHNLENKEIVQKFQGTKIRIKSTFDLLGLQLLLFLRKNVQIQDTNFTKDEFSIETYSKVYCFAKEIFDAETKVDYSLYDYSMTFANTFDIDALVDLYRQINGCFPSNEQINLALTHKQMNLIAMDPNHACNIAAMILETEHKMNLLEQNRQWSLPVLYNTIDPSILYDTIKSKIVLENYISS